MSTRIGFLPLYIKLYDDAGLVPRDRIERYRDQLAAVIRDRDICVEVAPVCRVRDEVAAALARFADTGVAGIVTVHLAYSPSGESAPLIAESSAPVLVWNTTPSATFAPEDDPALLSYNHGIHGVQDFCNVLLRHGKKHQIVSGHWEDDHVRTQVVDWCRGIGAAATFSSARVGIVGKPFPGMADFAVPDEMLLRLGITTIGYTASVGADVSEAIEEELANDIQRFAVDANTGAHKQSVAIGLEIRRWIEREQLDAFSVNFLDIDDGSNFPAMPFLEACKAMSRGIGYAGEGDVLTAAFVGSLMQAGLRTSFGEMFCPDWRGNRIFLSHMGEANLSCLDEPVRIVDKPFPFSDAEDTVSVAGRFVAGQAALIDLAPVRAESGGLSLRVIIVPGEIVSPDGEDNMVNLIRGWFAPAGSVAETLSAYSRAGGTHHLALVYGEPTHVLQGMCDAMRWDFETV